MIDWLGRAGTPNRGFLGSLVRQHRPLGGAGPVAGTGAAEVAARWASRLGVPTDALLLLPDADAAAQLLAAATVVPDEAALCAGPGAPRWPAAVLARGGRYVDAGRRMAGAIDIAAWRAACQRHPAAARWVAIPSWGSDDEEAIGPPPGVPADAVSPLLIDVSDAVSLSGASALAGSLGADAVVVALRDAREPHYAVLAGIVVLRGVAADLRLLAGPAQPTAPALRAALRALECADPAAEAHLAQAVTTARQRVEATAATWPGALPWLGSGLIAVVRCPGGDAPGLAAVLCAQGLPATAYGPELGHVVVVDLALAAALAATQG